MAARRVLLIAIAYDENRVPYIDFDVSHNDRGITQSRLKDLLMSGEDLSAYEPVTLMSSADLGGMDALAARGCGSPLMLSGCAVEVLWPYMEQCFDVLRVIVRGRPYCLIRAAKPIDALDREHCDLVLATDDPGKILIVERFVFFKDRLSDPLMFSVPEVKHQYFFCTDGIPSIIEKAKLRGFRFIEAEQEGAVYS